MAKRAITNLVSEGVEYVKGKVYSTESVAHLDQTNFEDVSDEALETGTTPEGEGDANVEGDLDSEQKEEGDVTPGEGEENADEETKEEGGTTPEGEGSQENAGGESLE